MLAFYFIFARWGRGVVPSPPPPTHRTLLFANHFNLTYQSGLIALKGWKSPPPLGGVSIWLYHGGGGHCKAFPVVRVGFRGRGRRRGPPLGLKLYIFTLYECNFFDKLFDSVPLLENPVYAPARCKPRVIELQRLDFKSLLVKSRGGGWEETVRIF